MAPQVTPQRDNAQRAAIAIISLGIALRLMAYAANRSFWEDEFNIALNLRFRGFWGLLYPLDYETTMPIPLMWAVKFLISLFGTSALVFRSIPFLAGCFFLPALWVCLRRFFGTAIAILAVSLAVVYPELIYYSQEFKQYSLDALVAVGVLWFGLGVLDDNSPRSWGALLAFGCLAITLSQPSVFLLAGVGLAAVCDQRFFASRRWRLQSIAAAAGWLVIFATMYWFSYRPVFHSVYMQTSSADMFLNPGHGFVHRLIVGLGTALGAYTLGIPRLLLAALFGAGLWAILRTKNLCVLAIVVGPYLLVFGAAAFRLYPLRPRLLLFTLPLLCLIYASGITAVCNFRLPRVWRIAAVSCLFFALVAPVLRNMPRWFEFVLYNFTPARQVIEHMNSIDSQSPVYVMCGDVRAWLYYAGNWMQPQILKQNIDAAYRLRFYGEDLGVREDRASNGGRLEIVGEFEPDSSADEAPWAAREAGRIAVEAGKSLWIFVPRYLRVANRAGEFRANRLLMLLGRELELQGGRCVNDQSRGETIARQYVFRDDRDSSNTSCPVLTSDLWR